LFAELRRDPKVAARRLAVRLAWALLAAGASLAVLIGGDLAAGYYFDGIKPLFPPAYLQVYVLLALFLSLSRGRWFRISGIAFLVLLQLVWLGMVAYSGDILRPEMVRLGLSQGFEIAGALAGEFELFLAPLVMAVLIFAGLLACQEAVGGRRALRGIAGNVLFVLLVVFGFARAGNMANYHVIYPNLYTPSVVGTINAVSLALRDDFGGFALEPTPNAAAYSYTRIEPAENPVTVAVIMGESISPLRMSLYGGRGITTTPRLEKLAEADQGYVLIPRLGFSAGTATLGSVPTFLNAVHKPQDVHGSGDSLLKIARNSGFGTAYLSAQRVKALELAGGPGAADYFETEEPWVDRIDEIRDDILLEHIDRVGAGAGRQFFFIHQRVNHGPYRVNCPNGFDADAVMGTQGDALQTNRRQREYDAGIVCYDRSLAMLLDRLRQRKGALYVFITADHNELMGLYGYWGHMAPILETALVPMMLYTNRPDSDVAARFKAEQWISAFELVRLVVRGMGTELRVSDYRPGVIFINKGLPYGGGGYLRATENADGSFAVASYGPAGELISDQSVRLSEAAYRFRPPR
jgi:glucan phosphoethanolaminetransferase (alkaline phosphatase superfamily)